MKTKPLKPPLSASTHAPVRKPPRTVKETKEGGLILDDRDAAEPFCHPVRPPTGHEEGGLSVAHNGSRRARLNRSTTSQRCFLISLLTSLNRETAPARRPLHLFL